MINLIFFNNRFDCSLIDYILQTFYMNTGRAFTVLYNWIGFVAGHCWLLRSTVVMGAFPAFF
jgi:hypothetical protein